MKQSWPPFASVLMKPAPTPNQAMKSTALVRCNFGEILTTPCGGLSYSCSDLMRHVAVLPTILICLLSSVAMGYELRQTVPAGADVNSPAGKYNLRVHKMLEENVARAFSTQARRLEVDYEFYLDPQGRVTSIMTDAKSGGQWAEQAIKRSIRSLKFPPVPAQALKEWGSPFRIWGTMSWDPPSLRPPRDRDSQKKSK